MSCMGLYNVTGTCSSQEDCPNNHQHCQDSVCVGKIFIFKKVINIDMFYVCTLLRIFWKYFKFKWLITLAGRATTAHHYTTILYGKV